MAPSLPAGISPSAPARSLLGRVARPERDAPRFTVVDYGMGNLASVVNALRFLGYEAEVADAPRAVADARAIVLPGVGAFAVAMQNLAARRLVAPLTEAVMVRRVPLLGICLGMQLLARSSEENGIHQGLGWIDSRVVAIDPATEMRVPHVGWRTLSASQDRLYAGIEHDAAYYFDHSFHLACDAGLVTATCRAAQPFVASIRSGNVFATQFHPEKSQRAGLRLLRNFARACMETTVVAAR
ncbi:MAG: imidazole glycerol phosphate synthase subunit HisH [Alphaproteobacteria bacterium]|nr:imidazole glycerol phosphate synthase subunit HisH [Alphaproteobacteria bacterium]